MKTITNITYLPFALCAMACFALSPTAKAVCQEGCNLNGGGTTVLGDNALLNNMGTNNTAVGSGALTQNTFGSDNTAIGELALITNDGDNNTAIGVQALQNNMTGDENTATGVDALQANTTGNDNTATGVNALSSNTTGVANTATGDGALFSNTTGRDNIALGFQAGLNLTTGNNNIEIGHVGAANDSRTIRIGKSGTQTKTFIAGISGATVAGGVGVIVGSNGQLGTVVSSERFKDAIQPMDKASDAILAMKPVTFRYKQELDPKGIPQFGLVAEEVEKVNPDLVARDEQGKPYTVRYEAVNAMLLNEFLKEHKAFLKEQRKVEKLEATVANLIATVKAQSAQIQKVNAQLELSRPAPQTVLNSQ